MTRSPSVLVAVALAAALAWPGRLPGQSFRRGGVEFNAMRMVEVPQDKKYSVVVTQFFHHGEISADGRNVVVSAQNQKLVPTRVLQLGPGDYCRLAFETLAGQHSYEVLYGGCPPEEGVVPAWTNRDGLLLETREYKECNSNSFESVRAAFQSSKRIGSDYVQNVQHAHNPFSLKPGPFLSRYSGYLHVGATGMYGFMTSSQDCSFLVIDDKVVVAAPGRHAPQRRAMSGSRKDIRLSEGAHKFEYYHAATGPAAMMVAAWEVPPGDPAKPKPAAIPTEAFRTAAIGHVEAGPVSTRAARLVPDFLVNIAGDVPLPDNDLPLIGVRFMNASPPALTLKANVLWQFGDGQTSEEPNPVHVYLRPDVYPVKLSVRRGTKTSEMEYRVYVGRPKVFKEEEFHKLDNYLPILETYDPQTLDAVSLRQLVLAYQFKADTILAPPEPEEDEQTESEEEQPEPEPDPKKPEEEAEAKRAEALKYVTAAVTAGQVAFLGAESAAQGDEDLIKLVRLVGPMARNQVGDSLMAARIWHGASRKIVDDQLKAECEIESADIAVNDLLKQDVAKSLLEAATARLRKGRTGPVASRLERVWGDYYAHAGDGQNARKSYSQAEAVLASTRRHIERTAWQGAHSRSVDQFLKTGELDRAAGELRAWQDEFPADKIDGYLNLMFARYWAGREMYAQAVALADCQLAVNPDSPYIDRLLLLAADCEVKRGQVDAALAILNQLLKDYPGSPLVPVVRENIAKLEAGKVETPRKPSGRRRPGSE